MNRTFVLGLALVVGVAASLVSTQSYAQDCCYDSGARRTFRVVNFRARRTRCVTPAVNNCCPTTPVANNCCGTSMNYATPVSGCTGIAPVAPSFTSNCGTSNTCSTACNTCNTGCNTCATGCNTCGTTRPMIVRRAVRSNNYCNTSRCGTCNVASNCGTCNTCNQPMMATRSFNANSCGGCNSMYTTVPASPCSGGFATPVNSGTVEPQSTQPVNPSAPADTKSDT